MLVTVSSIRLGVSVLVRPQIGQLVGFCLTEAKFIPEKITF